MFAIKIQIREVFSLYFFHLFNLWINEISSVTQALPVAQLLELK